jgi:ubiquinone biosynthesis protein
LVSVVVILMRHLFGYAVGLLRVDRFVPFHHGLFGHVRRNEPYTRPEHVRLAVEELGVASIKIGQILSTRGDLLPPAYQGEFAKLQDAAPPEPAAAIRAALGAELDRPIEAVFATFDPRPVAAASIGQAHAATLPDGAEVIVKIRRPGVVEQVEVDLDILDRVVRQLTRWSRTARRYDLSGLAREFAATLRAELDYEREARNIERFATNFAHNPTIHIPRVHRESTTSRVLTLERLHGLKVDDLAGLDAAGIDRARLAQHATTAMLRMIFEHGFFHADPHPGNFFIEPGGRIGLIDFGMVGTVDPATRTALRAVLLVLVDHNATPLVDAFTTLGMMTMPPDRDVLAADFASLISEHLLRPLAEVALGSLLHDVLTVVRRHHLHLPPNLALLAKTLAMCEGIAAQLDPTFQMTVAVAPFLPHLLVAEDPARPGVPRDNGAAPGAADRLISSRQRLAPMTTPTDTRAPGTRTMHHGAHRERTGARFAHAACVRHCPLLSGSPQRDSVAAADGGAVQWVEHGGGTKEST